MGTAEERLREQLAEMRRPPYRSIAGWSLAASGLTALGVLVLVFNPLADIYDHMSTLVGFGVLSVAGVDLALWSLRRHRESIHDREQLITEMRRAEQRAEDHATMAALVTAQERLVRAHSDQAEAVARLAALIEATMPHSKTAREHMAAFREDQAEVKKTVKAVHETLAVLQQELPPVAALAELQQRAGEHEQRLEKVEERVDVAYTTGFTDGITATPE